MTYEPWRDNSYLLRFEHILEKNEDPELSKPATFNLTEIFPGDFVFSETALAANQWIEDMDRVHFKPEGAKSSMEVGKLSSSKISNRKVLENLEITLNPMEIRTFVMSQPISFGIKNQQVFTYFPLIVLAALLKNLL